MANEEAGQGTLLYRAFISYSRADRAIAKALQAKLENYVLPQAMRLIRPGVRRDSRPLKPVFRDEDELVPGQDLPKRILEGLRGAEYLIVLCSPHAAKSEWVEKEILDFAALGKGDNILAVVVEGEPHASARGFDASVECLPAALRFQWEPVDHKSGEPALGISDAPAEPLWVDWRGAATKDRTMFLRLVAALLSLSRLDDLIQRDAQARRRRIFISTAFIIAFAAAAAAGVVLYQETRHSLGLALLAKAARSLDDDHPAHALAPATAAVTASNPIEHLFLGPPLGPSTDEGLRALSVAEVAERANAKMVWGIKLGGQPSAVAISDDGQYFAVGDVKGSIFVGSVDGVAKAQSSHSSYQPEIRLVGEATPIMSLKFTPDGRSVVSSSSEGSVTVWDLQDHRSRTLCTPDGGYVHVAVDPSGRFAAASFDNSSRLSIWNIAALAPTPTASIAMKLSTMMTIDFSPDGRFLGATDTSGVVRIFRVGDWRSIASLPTGKTNLVGLSFSPDGARIAAASQDGVIVVWKIPAPGGPNPEHPVVTLDHPAGEISAVRYSPNGRFLATAGTDGAVRFWDSVTFRPAGSIDGNDSAIQDIAFAQKAPRLISADDGGALRVWDTDSVEPIAYSLQDTARETTTGRYSRDGSHFATAGLDGAARLYNVDQKGGLHFVCGIMQGGVPSALAFSPDGKRIASSGFIQTPASYVHIWDTDRIDGSGACHQEIPITLSTDVYSLVWSGNGKGQIAWGDDSGGIWTADGEAPNTTARRVTVAHKGVVEALDFSPDGRLLASGGEDGRIVISDAVTGKVFWSFNTGGKPADAIKFLPNGWLASTAGDDQLSIWDPSAANPLVHSYKLPGRAKGLALSRDGGALAAGGDRGAIIIWSTKTWRRTFQLTGVARSNGVFDIDPARGDLAYDGGGGLVRVLPRATDHSAIEAREREVVLDGTDTYFDRALAEASHGGGLEIVSTAPTNCPARH